MFHLGLPQTAELALAQAMAAATALPYLCVFFYCCVHFLSLQRDSWSLCNSRDVSLKAADDVVESPAKRICSHCMQSEIGTCFLLTSFPHSFFLTVSVMFPPFSSLMESFYFVPLLKLPPMLFPCSTLRSHFFCEQQRAEFFVSFYTALCTIQAATPG
jgi:hypothetical protein